MISIWFGQLVGFGWGGLLLSAAALVVGLWAGARSVHWLKTSRGRTEILHNGTRAGTPDLQVPGQMLRAWFAHGEITR